MTVAGLYAEKGVTASCDPGMYVADIFTIYYAQSHTLLELIPYDSVRRGHMYVADADHVLFSRTQPLA